MTNSLWYHKNPQRKLWKRYFKKTWLSSF